MATDQASGGRLLERELELERLRDVLDGAAAGDGGVLVAAAPAGLGKTRLLDAAVEDSPSVGARALVARASELEHGFAFGVVRQLVEAPVLAAAPEVREALLAGAARHAAAVLELGHGAPADPDFHATLHGLYWLVVNLSATSPLLIAVDDLQWADEPSVCWLAYVARRLERLPIALVATIRTHGDAGRPELIAPSDAGRDAVEELLERALQMRLEPAPLSVGAVTELLERELLSTPDPSFAAACTTQTGGNPFLLTELAGELRARDVRPTAASVSLLGDVVPERVGETTRRHLRRVSPEARALAGSVAVVGDGAELAVAAELSGLSATAAASAAAELVAAQILADAATLRFRHPLLRAAVEAERTAVELAGEHGRAARSLGARGAPSGRIAAHLLAATRGDGDPWAVEHLRAAARAARAQGVPGQAAALLTRALAEPPSPELRGAVLEELGEAELVALDSRAFEHLRDAFATATEPRDRARISLRAGVAGYHAGRHQEAVELLLASIEEIAGTAELREEWLCLEAFLALAGRYDLATERRTRGRVHALAGGLTGATTGERLVRAVAAAETAGSTADELFRATAEDERVWGERPWPDPSEGPGTVAMYLHAGRPDAAEALVERLFAATREQGSPLRHALAVACRGFVALDVGDLRTAEADMATALAVWRDVGDKSLGPTSSAYYVLVLAWRGRIAAAEAVLDDYGFGAAVPERMFFNPMLFCRGTLRMEQRRFADAEADFRELGRRHEQWGMTRPSPPWRSATAFALIAQGRLDEARPLAEEELALVRRWNTPKAIAFATRALALTRDGDASIAGLAAAVELLDGTPWRLDRARAQVDLGAAWRRAGRRRDGRALLATAMDAAHACGAEPLAARAAEELQASGARPRRRAISGVDALTPSELRVATLAAERRTNREIAQELFVTMATVETHLTRAYRKLDVDGRARLAEALG